MTGGCKGKILWIDLDKQQWHIKEISEEMVKKWIGASGLAASIISESISAEIDPLSSENLLVFATGPMTGTMVPSSGRHIIAGKSPLTGIWGESSVGGNWGRALRKAGFDAVVLSGKAPEPVYVWIYEGSVEIRKAGSLWGMDTYQTYDAVRKQTHAKAEICTIGPAGERMAKIAGFFTDGSEGRAAARCGLGAVAGAKKVKAIAVYGTKEPEVANAAELRKSIKEVLPGLVEKTKIMANFGTAGLVIPCEQLGDFPIRNWSRGSWSEGAKKISGVQLAETYLTGRFHCSNCPIGCGRRISIKDGPYAGVEGSGPEYETLGLLGGSCLIDDLSVICYANELCNRYGIDTIEAGNLVAFSMEAYEKGIISRQDTGGLKITWGDPETLLTLIRQMGEGNGFGEILAQGYRGLLERYGDATREILMASKGLSFPAHDPRAYNSIAVGYATANRGACHLEAFSHIFERAVTMPELGIEKPLDRFLNQGKGILTAKAQNLMSVFDSLAVCKFVLFGGIGVGILADWLSFVTGMEWSVQELLTCGERIFNLKRLFNIKCGVSRKDDVLPARILAERREVGGASENLPLLTEMLDEYYNFRGWNANGIPIETKLRELGI